MRGIIMYPQRFCNGIRYLDVRVSAESLRPLMLCPVTPPL